jgi:DNA processing protein
MGKKTNQRRLAHQLFFAGESMKRASNHIPKVIEKNLSLDLLEVFRNERKEFHIKHENSGFITYFDDIYPESLKSLGNHAPMVLSYVGNIDLLKRDSVGFCGSRKASEKGLTVTKDCAQQLAKTGFAIISGYASGVDITAHKTALENNGETIIVIPEGINHFRIKDEVKKFWDWNRALIISEFMPESAWSVSNAMQRNSTIVALSKAMILIESSANGGSMDAGKKTLEMKKPLYTPFYEGMPESAIGNRILIEKGAIKLGRKRETGRANITKIISPQPPKLPVDAVCENKVQIGLFEIFETNGKE